MKQFISIQVAMRLLLLIPGLALAAEGTKISAVAVENIKQLDLILDNFRKPAKTSNR